ncbi:MAG: PASTA domain-containing protein [Deferribacteres bacterium]|nr:PASTA domain-containing protein [Deferribacteres bacterium]
MGNLWLRLQILWQKQWLRILVYAFAGFVVLAGLMDMVVMPLYTRHGQAIPLPDVTKMMYEDAKAKLSDEGFKIIREEERYDSAIPSGYVIEQNPKGGALVKSGRQVYVIISRGELKVTMPDLTEKSIREATLQMNRLGLAIGSRRYEPSSYYFENVVMHQSISPGVEVSRGTRVDVTISIGDVAEEIVVPLVEGRTLDDAKERLGQKGFQIGTITYQEMASLLPETVIKQSIAAGTLVNREEKIDLIVSTLPRGGQ